jgi:uncharacterized RDD family membrane protein YckC
MTAASTPAPPDLLWRRVGAAIIDVAIVVAIAIVAGIVFRRVSGLAAVVVLAYELVVWVWWQGRSGASPGKQLVGLRVVDASGQPCGTGKAAVRWVAWLIDGFPYCLPLVGFVMIFTNADQRRVGDRLAGTWVVGADDVGRRPTAAGPAQPSTPGGDQVWDDARQAYVRTDPTTDRREAFDEASGTWSALDD